MKSVNVYLLISIIQYAEATGFVVIPMTRTAVSSVYRREIVQENLISDNGKVLFSFCGTLNIGTPSQAFSVLFDSGSFATWVRSSKCHSNTCKDLPEFDGSKSSTFVDTSQVAVPLHYLDGTTVTGTIAVDDVRVGTLIAKQFSFTQANYVSDATIDGVVGMGRTGSGLLFNAFLKSGSLQSQVFSYWVHQDNANANLILGGVDTAQLQGGLAWLRTISSIPSWSVTMGNIAVTSVSGITSSINVDKTLYAVFDTGTSLTYLGVENAKKLNTKLGLSLYLEISTANSAIYQADCDIINSLPTITLTLDSNQIQLNPTEYILQFGGTNDQTVCISAFVGTNLTQGMGMLIGNSLLRNWYTVFDVGNMKIGVGMAIRQQSATSNLTGVANVANLKTSGGVDHVISWNFYIVLSILLLII